MFGESSSFKPARMVVCDSPVASAIRVIPTQTHGREVLSPGQENAASRSCFLRPAALEHWEGTTHQFSHRIIEEIVAV